MKKKKITLRMISTGGTLTGLGVSAKGFIKVMRLDPEDWEEVKPQPGSEEEPIGDNQVERGSDES